MPCWSLAIARNVYRCNCLMHYRAVQGHSFKRLNYHAGLPWASLSKLRYTLLSNSYLAILFKSSRATGRVGVISVGLYLKFYLSLEI